MLPLEKAVANMGALKMHFQFAFRGHRIRSRKPHQKTFGRKVSPVDVCNTTAMVLTCVELQPPFSCSAPTIAGAMQPLIFFLSILLL